MSVLSKYASVSEADDEANSKPFVAKREKILVWLKPVSVKKEELPSPVLSKYASVSEADHEANSKPYVVKREKILVTPKPVIVKEEELPSLGMQQENIRRRMRGYGPINDATHACLKLKECIVCHEIDPKMQKCSGCRWAYYCSAVCQRADWANHKTICDISREF